MSYRRHTGPGRVQMRACEFLAAGMTRRQAENALAKEGHTVHIATALEIAETIIHQAPVKKRGPWPVAWVYPSGERVFDVGGGHVIGERSLAAFGFAP